MEKERVRFENYRHPILLFRLTMRKGETYRSNHSHKAIEVVWVKNGSLTCYVNEEVLQVGAGEVIFINTNKIHRLTSDHAQISYLHIDTGLLEENQGNNAFSRLCAFISQTQSRPYLIFEDNREIKQLLRKIEEKYDDASKASDWYIKAYHYELVAFMYAKAFISPLTIPKEQIQKIMQVVNYIDANFRSPITLEDICTAVKYNKFTICHTFKGVTGSTIFDYINFLRVYHGMEKLAESSSSVLQIATECGFSSATYFNRVFKAYFGCAPSVYRKLLRKNTVN